MASLLAILLRRGVPTSYGSKSFRLFPFSQIGTSREFSAPTAPTSGGLELVCGDDVSSSYPTEAPEDLRSRIFRLWLPKWSATSVIDKWIAEGRKVTAPELRKIAWDLKKSRRFKHALEIFTWMESQSRFQASAADRAAKLDLIIKVNGKADAEFHFEQISNCASRKAAFLPLLNSYVKERNVEKAEALLAEIDDHSFIVDPYPFIMIMKLYMATSRFTEVIYVIRHMKRNKIPLNVLSYNLWMSACGELSDLTSLETILDEMMRDKNVEAGWSTYCTLANIFIRFGLLDKAFAAIRTAEDLLSTKKRLGFSFVMTIYASLGDKDGVLRLWESSKGVAGKIPCANYMSVMCCLVKLGAISEAERVFKEWESRCWKYDIRVPNILLGAHMRNGCMEKAELLFRRATKKGAIPNYKTWEILMEGWAKGGQMDKAVEAMKNGLSMLEHCVWRPPFEILLAVSEYYEEHHRVEDGKSFVEVLRHFRLMNLQLYKSFVRMHVRAKTATPNILKMMAGDGIEPDEEIRLLVRSISDEGQL